MRQYFFLLHTYYRLHRKITLGSFNTGPYFATLVAQSRDGAKNPYNMGFWHCLSILAPLLSVAIEIECSTRAPCKIKNGRRKNNNTRSTVKPTFGARRRDRKAKLQVEKTFLRTMSSSTAGLSSSHETPDVA